MDLGSGGVQVGIGSGQKLDWGRAKIKLGIVFVSRIGLGSCLDRQWAQVWLVGIKLGGSRIRLSLGQVESRVYAQLCLGLRVH